MKEQIDNELKNITFNFDMDKMLCKKNRKRVHHRVLMAVVCLILIGTTVQAGYTLYNCWMKINGETLPELDSMQRKDVNLLGEKYKISDAYQKKYDSYAVLQEELGIQLLHSDMTDDNSSMIITRKTDNEHWTQIKIIAYIVGDVTELKKIDGRDQYTWTPGKHFLSPIDMSIDIISSQEQMEIGWEKEYLGAYDFVESFQMRDGYKVNILSSGETGRSKPMNQAVFVVDGIRYTVRGKVDIDLLKKIIDSFYY